MANEVEVWMTDPEADREADRLDVCVTGPGSLQCPPHMDLRTSRQTEGLFDICRIGKLVKADNGKSAGWCDRQNHPIERRTSNWNLMCLDPLRLLAMYAQWRIDDSVYSSQAFVTNQCSVLHLQYH